MPSSNPYIKVPVCVGGQRADLDQKDVPPGSMYYSRNWVLQDGKFQIRNGTRLFGVSLEERPLSIIQYVHNDMNRRTVIGTPTKWFNWDLSSSDWVDITDPLDPLTGSPSSVQNLRNFYKSGVCYVVGVNGHSDTPKAWDGTSATYDEVGGTPYNAKCLAVIANRMLLGNLYYSGAEHPCDVDVSAFNDFESGWMGATQLTALTDTPGEITEMREMGNLNATIYKSDSIYMATAQGALYPFSFQLVQTGIRGPLNGRAVVSTPSAQYFLSPDCNVYMFNGYQVTPLPPAIQSHIFNTADINNLGMAFGYYRSQKQEIRFIYPESSTGKYLGIRIRLVDGTVWPVTWTDIRPSLGLEAVIQYSTLIRDLVNPLSYYIDAIKDWRSFNEYALLGDASGQIVQNNSENTTDLGLPIEAVLETGMVAQNDARRYFSAQESEHFFVPVPVEFSEGWDADGWFSGGWFGGGIPDTQTVDIQLGSSQIGEDPVYDTAVPISLSISIPYKVGHRSNSRMFSLKISVSASVRVKWRGSQINGIPRGYR